MGYASRGDEHGLSIPKHDCFIDKYNFVLRLLIFTFSPGNGQYKNRKPFS